MFKRYFLLIATNILVSITLFFIASFVMRYLGLDIRSYTGLLFFCFLLGMGGAFVSLLISKWTAKRFMGLISADRYPSLVQKVHSISRKAGLSEMPEVYIFESNEINAFATGPSKDNSLVAVSTGLLQKMNDDEVDGVIAHEVSHIANGDMVTMTLVQGVVNTFAMFISYIVSNIIMNSLRGENDDRRGGIGSFFLYHLIHSIVHSLVSFLSLPLIMWVSRWREYRADAGSAKLVGKEKMIMALEALKRNYPQLEKHDKNIEVMAISSKTSFAEIFSSHPPLDKRIKELQTVNLTSA